MENNKKTIAITGANGFVGSNLAISLAAEGYEVKALVRKTSDTSLLPSAINPYRVDYTDEGSLCNILEECDVIVHNAAITRGRNWSDYERYNIALTEKLVKAANRVDKLNHFLFLSSQAAAGCSVQPKKETDKCMPLSHYGKSKLIAENIVKNEFKKNWTIARPCSVYGPGDKDFLQYFKMVGKGFAVIAGWKKKLISLIYIDQLCECLTKMAFNPQVFDKILFLSDGNCYSWEDFIHTMEIVTGKKTRRIKVPHFFIPAAAICAEISGVMTRRVPLLNRQKAKEITASHWICDNSEVKRLLAVDFNHSLKENLWKTYAWYKENEWL